MHIRYGLMPLPYLPWNSWDPSDPQSVPSGFIVDLLAALGPYMNWNLTFVPTTVNFAMKGDSFLQEVRQQLSDGAFDMTLLYYDDPVAGFGEPLASVRQSVAFHTQWHAVGIQKIKTPPSLFALFAPFDNELWYAIGGFALAYAALLYLLNLLAGWREGHERRLSLREAGMMT